MASPVQKPVASLHVAATSRLSSPSLGTKQGTSHNHVSQLKAATEVDLAVVLAAQGIPPQTVRTMCALKAATGVNSPVSSARVTRTSLR